MTQLKSRHLTFWSCYKLQINEHWLWLQLLNLALSWEISLMMGE